MDQLFIAIAFVGQPSSQTLQSMQFSSMTTAFLLSLTLIASDGQLSSHVAHPSHLAGSTTAGIGISFKSKD
jgi:hypothetical protein